MQPISLCLSTVTIRTCRTCAFYVLTHEMNVYISSAYVVHKLNLCVCAALYCFDVLTIYKYIYHMLCTIYVYHCLEPVMRSIYQLIPLANSNRIPSLLDCSFRLRMWSHTEEGYPKHNLSCSLKESQYNYDLVRMVARSPLPYCVLQSQIVSSVLCGLARCLA
jgi:hypothetical protein